MKGYIECPTCEFDWSAEIECETEHLMHECENCGQIYFWSAEVIVEVSTETIESRIGKLKLSIKRHEEVGITDVADRLKAVLAELEAAHVNHD